MKLDRILPLLLTTEQGSRLGNAMAGLFTGLAFLSFITLLNGWWFDARLSSLKDVTTSAMKDVISPMNELIRVVPQAHLFGYHAPASSYVPITSSQLRLTGIIQLGSEEEDNSFSKALISVQGGIGKVYQVGDVLPDGVKLTGIQPDAVILDNNGHSERLPLQRARLRRS